MTRDDDAVAGHLVRRLVPEGGPGCPDCPGDNALAAFLEGRLPMHTRAEVERHLLACEACRVVVSEALALRSGTAHADAGSVGYASSRRFRLALAAAAVLVVGVGATIWALVPAREAPSPEPETVLFASAAALRTARPDLFADFEPLSPAELAAMTPSRLRGALAVLRPAETLLDPRPGVEWVAAPGATGYEVTLGIDGGAVVWRRTVARETSMAYPADAAALAAGGKYVVRVEARGPLGRTEAMRRFAVAGEKERARFAAGLEEIDRRAPGSHRSVLRAQFALRRGFLLEAEGSLRTRLEQQPDDALARDTLLYVRRRLGVPEP